MYTIKLREELPMKTVEARSPDMMNAAQLVQGARVGRTNHLPIICLSCV